MNLSHFIEFCLAHQAMRFGSFTLKSGRISPYFFNAGVFHTGEALSIVGGYYVKALCAASIDFDVLFGPAYKGIPLVSATAIAFFTAYHRIVPYTFDRKEIKNYGESGPLVGAPLCGQRVVIVDDVITAGTAIQNSIRLIREAGGILVGIVVLLDRQERAAQGISTVQSIEAEYGIPVLSVMRLADILDFVKHDPAGVDYREAVQAYHQAYGLL